MDLNKKVEMYRNVLLVLSTVVLSLIVSIMSAGVLETATITVAGEEGLKDAVLQDTDLTREELLEEYGELEQVRGLDRTEQQATSSRDSSLELDSQPAAEGEGETLSSCSNHNCDNISVAYSTMEDNSVQETAHIYNNTAESTSDSATAATKQIHTAPTNSEDKLEEQEMLSKVEQEGKDITPVEHPHIRGMGDSPENPAPSCKTLTAAGYPSGTYWMSSSSPASGDKSIRVFCDTTRQCGGKQGGWVRVAHLNMTDPQHSCPKQWKEISLTDKRLCGRTDEDPEDGSGCSSAFFSTNGVRYSHVCGRVIGYQFCNTMSFWSYYHNMDSTTIDDPYVDGVTILHGTPRKHVWTFSAALHEGYTGRDAICPCTKPLIENQYRLIRIPPWVKEDYFCETGATSEPPKSAKLCSSVYEKAFYSNDPLWEGRDCGASSSCCKFNNPPWFYRELQGPVTDDIEMRICGSSFTSFGDTPVGLVEIYVQ